MRIGIIIKRYIFITIFTLIFMSFSTSALVWNPNSSVNNNYGDVGANFRGNMFNMSDTWITFAGEQSVAVNTFVWNNNQWSVNTSYSTNLEAEGEDWISTSFFLDGKWNLISGTSANGVSTGRDWNGTAWNTNSSIVSGLTVLDYHLSPIVFNMGGAFYLITGHYSGVSKDWHGYNWNGSGWVINTSITNGLVNNRGGYYPNAGFVFLNPLDNTWYFIESTVSQYGYYWNGSTWISDNTVISGLLTGENFRYFGASRDETFHLVVGKSDGTTTGYNINRVSSIPQISIPVNNSRHYNNSINLTWNQSTDADGDSITYHSQLSNQSNFGYIVNQSNVSNNWTGNIAITDGVTYYSRVRSYDGYEYSNWSNIVQFTENSKPVYSNRTLLPASPSITDNLTISYSLTDANGDSVTNYTRWYKDNVLQSSLNNRLFVNATGNTSLGEVWRYEIFGNDTYENSTAESSNEVIIGSTNSYPSFTSLVLTPNSKKYNKTININASGISDDNTTWQVQTYYLINGSTKVYLVNSSWITTTYANLTATIPWSDGGLHTIYALVYDSGNATGVENLSSSPIPATFTSLITAPSLVSSSIDDTTINTGGSVIISSQVDGMGANVTWAKALVRRPDATSANWTMTCGSGENVSCTYTYTSTSDVGNYYVDYFYILDDSGNLGEIAPDTTLNFYASTPVVPPSSGGGGSPIPKATPKANLSDVVLQIKKISPELPSRLTELIAECYTKDVLLEGKCATINLSEPMNWWPLLGAYIASFFTIFGIAIITRKPRNLIVDGLLYGTIVIVIIQLIVIMGFNAYFMSYLMQSDLPAFMFVSVVAWSVPIAYIGDSFYSRKVKGSRFKNKKT